jgi:hypothetical protein
MFFSSFNVTNVGGISNLWCNSNPNQDRAIYPHVQQIKLVKFKIKIYPHNVHRKYLIWQSDLNFII